MERAEFPEHAMSSSRSSVGGSVTLRYMAPPVELAVHVVNVQLVMTRFVLELTVAEIAPPFLLVHLHLVNVDPHTSTCPSALNANTVPSALLHVSLMLSVFSVREYVGRDVE